tara:strand:- start:5614 stop:7704 length:2091 start_codon:yes stop_codon:yes gene_type:complete
MVCSPFIEPYTSLKVVSISVSLYQLEALKKCFIIELFFLNLIKFLINKQIMIFFRYIILISFLGSLLFGALLKPYNDQRISYTHILFEWEQQPNAVEYQIQLSDSNSFTNPDNLLLDRITSRLVYIYKDPIDWDHTYFWRVRDVYSDNSYGPWTIPSSFIIEGKKYEPNSGELFIEQSSNNNKLTLLGDLSGGLSLRSFVFDQDGKEIWNADVMLSYISEYGELFGSSYMNFPSNTGVKFNYDSDILWHGPYDVYIDIHEIKSIPNGNYMGFVWEFENGPIPIGDWTDLFGLLGYEADGVTNEFPWFGQAIVEWDENSDEVWRWSPFDHFTMNDYDAYGGTWWNAYFDGQYDWMHSNAFHFDAEESVIYFSSRHLSRITKIDYPSGDIIWMIGLPNNFEGSVSNHICTDLGFTWQHNVQLLENGNILLFDNGNLSPLFGDDNPTSRALEFKVIDDSYCELVWEYELHPTFYGPWMGSVQSLDNDNYFINTVGSGGHAIEVSEDGDIIWDGQYQFSEYPSDPGGNYRSYKIPSIHPNAYSVLFENYITDDREEGIYFSDNINISIFNESGYKQYYNYHLSDTNGWFEEVFDSVILEPYSSVNLTFSSSNINGNDLAYLTFNIEPVYHSYDSKNYNFNIYSLGLSGDLNSDGILNILDVIILVGIILDSGETTFSSDVNGDGIINILDVVTLVNIILE